MKKIIGLLILFMGFGFSSYAQEENELGIGDSVYFGRCKGDQYVFVDLYTKTRWENTSLTYNREDGTGFYEYFFTTGDFDIKRLPCSFANSKGIITAIQIIEEAGKPPRTVLFVSLEENAKVAWIEAEKAFESGEVEIR